MTLFWKKGENWWNTTKNDPFLKKGRKLVEFHRKWPFFKKREKTGGISPFLGKNRKCKFVSKPVGYHHFWEKTTPKRPFLTYPEKTGGYPPKMTLSWKKGQKWWNSTENDPFLKKGRKLVEFHRKWPFFLKREKTGGIPPKSPFL